MGHTHTYIFDILFVDLDIERKCLDITNLLRRIMFRIISLEIRVFTELSATSEIKDGSPESLPNNNIKKLAL